RPDQSDRLRTEIHYADHGRIGIDVHDPGGSPLLKRHLDLKNEFYECVRNETQQTPETETRLRETVTKLKKTVAEQRTEIQELRDLVTRPTLASAVLTQGKAASAGPASTTSFRSLDRQRAGLLWSVRLAACLHSIGTS
ncbi:hypothetical protein ACNPQM_43110, partial [Streptomyces sp. NPDC056231]